MSDEKAQTEEAAGSENDWVRARILKQDAPPEANHTSKANELFAQARAIVKENDLPLAYGLYWLGVFHNLVSHDTKRAEAALMEALAIQRRALGSDNLQLAETMKTLAYAKHANTGVHSAIALMEEALRIQRTQLLPTDQAVLDTENRLTILQTLARTEAYVRK